LFKESKEKMYFIRLRPNRSRVHAIRLDRMNVLKYATSGYGNHSSSRDSTPNNSQHKPKSSQNSNNKHHEKIDSKNEKNFEDNKIPKYRRALDHQAKDDLVDGSYWSEPVGSKKYVKKITMKKFVY
ncbi:418_t:CDS:2, partial [Dentiscutata heterogama]